MRCTALFLLATALTARAEDPLTDQFRAFLGDLKGRWAAETHSESRTVLIKEFRKFDHAEAVSWLVSDVLSKESAADVVREALRILGGYKNLAAVAEILQSYDRKLKDREMKAHFLPVLGRLSGEESLTRIEQALKQSDARILIGACDAAGIRKMPELRPLVVALLKHRTMQVRVAALQALLAMRAEEALPEIFQLFCAETSNRVRYEAWCALTSLVRDTTLPYDPAAWKEWHAQRVAEVPAGQPNPWGAFPSIKGTPAKPAWFFAIPVFADRICFVIDTSGDMNNGWAVDPYVEQQKKEPEQIPGFFAVKTRWLLARNHIRRCLELLPESTEVAFVFFNKEIQPYPEDRVRYLKNSSGTRDRILRFLDDEVKRTATTDMYDAFKAAWGFLGNGNADKNFSSGCDTILFVTDGLPTDGEMKNRADRLRDEIWKATFLPRIRVHTVGLHNHAYELLKNAAKDSGGLYVHAQEQGDEAEPQDLEFWPAKKKAFEEAPKAKKH
ncbi:MAG: hypothetical protein ACT4PV_15675 [Planctomycetaceae bacterium]